MIEVIQKFSQADVDAAYQQGWADAKRACLNLIVQEDLAANWTDFKEIKDAQRALRQLQVRIARDANP